MPYDITPRLYISTVADDAAPLAQKYGLGLELAEFCTAMNMDADFGGWDAIVRDKMRCARRFVFHAPFNELCPAAIDPLVLDAARRRYGQAYELMRSYEINKMVVHSGFVPLVYFKEYFAEKSVIFWREFLSDKPGDFSLYLENVLEDSPELLRDIVSGVDDPRMKLCLDIGHANTVVSDVPIKDWIDCSLAYLGHVHVHNNFRQWDHHNPLGDGVIDVADALSRILSARPDVSVTIESLHAEPSIRWLIENGFMSADAERAV